MHYLGGKARLAKQIANYLESIRQGRDYLEPFVGAANVIQHMTGKRTGADIHPDLIMLLNALRSHVSLPESISEEEYHFYKNAPTSAIRGFVGFACSWGGKWFGGYARDPESPRNFAKDGRNSLLRKAKNLQDVEFICADYRTLNPKNKLIYADPPYRGTTTYKIASKFDTDEFWDVMRKWAKQGNAVIVSEYEAPSDCRCVLEIPTTTMLRDGNGRTIPRVEKLFAV